MPQWIWCSLSFQGCALLSIFFIAKIEGEKRSERDGTRRTITQQRTHYTMRKSNGHRKGTHRKYMALSPSLLLLLLSHSEFCQHVESPFMFYVAKKSCIACYLTPLTSLSHVGGGYSELVMSEAFPELPVLLDLIHCKPWPSYFLCAVQFSGPFSTISF